jgi:hypothetical protein
VRSSRGGLGAVVDLAAVDVGSDGDVVVVPETLLLLAALALVAHEVVDVAGHLVVDRPPAGRPPLADLLRLGRALRGGVSGSGRSQRSLQQAPLSYLRARRVAATTAALGRAGCPAEGVQ